MIYISPIPVYIARCRKIHKHDRHLEALIEGLNTTNSTVIRNHQIFSKKRRLVAEIDLMTIHKHHINIYEVKCSFRINKAKRQLQKIKKILERIHSKPINLYFYHGDGQELVEI